MKISGINVLTSVVNFVGNMGKIIREIINKIIMRKGKYQ